MRTMTSPIGGDAAGTGKGIAHGAAECCIGNGVHFVHVRSKHENALPLIVTHGWPGSVIEQLKIVDPLANPTANDASPSDAFHLVIPSIPGYGFSAKPTSTGWDPARIARAWVMLMKRLRYAQFVAQGGDWGAGISDVMAQQTPPELLGIHVNLPGTVPPDIAKALQSGDPPPAGLSTVERSAYQQLTELYTRKRAYALAMGTRPQTFYGLADSPVPFRRGLSITATVMASPQRRSWRPCSSAPATVDTPSAPSRATTFSTTSRSIG
jgi:pimeloyl-ACP methyl ester carboxylesterase